jgi:hypothetical protein
MPSLVFLEAILPVRGGMSTSPEAEDFGLTRSSIGMIFA